MHLRPSSAHHSIVLWIAGRLIGFDVIGSHANVGKCCCTQHAPPACSCVSTPLSKYDDSVSPSLMGLCWHTGSSYLALPISHSICCFLLRILIFQFWHLVTLKLHVLLLLF